MARIGKELKAKGQFTTKAGIVRKHIGRPPLVRRPSRKPKRFWRAGRGSSIRRGTVASARAQCISSSDKWLQPKRRRSFFCRSKHPGFVEFRVGKSAAIPASARVENHMRQMRRDFAAPDPRGNEVKIKDLTFWRPGSPGCRGGPRRRPRTGKRSGGTAER
jgi:hypothetical protein